MKRIALTSVVTLGLLFGSAAAPADAATYREYSYTRHVSSLKRSYGCGSAPLTIRAYMGHQGATDIYRDGRIYIAPRLSSARLRYVVAHECAHYKQWRAYGGNVSRMTSRMNAIYGGRGFTGIERNADCVTVLMGLGGQHYTRYCSGARRTAASNTMAMRRS